MTELFIPDLEQQEPLSRAWQIDFEKNKLGGMVEGLEAVLQAAYTTLKIPKYRHIIYPWSFGSELHTLIGKDKDYAFSEAKRMICEALASDVRIIAVKNFAIKDNVLFFTIETVYGNSTMNTEVSSK